MKKPSRTVEQLRARWDSEPTTPGSKVVCVACQAVSRGLSRI